VQTKSISAFPIILNSFLIEEAVKFLKDYLLFKKYDENSERKNNKLLLKIEINIQKILSHNICFK